MITCRECRFAVPYPEGGVPVFAQSSDESSYRDPRIVRSSDGLAPGAPRIVTEMFECHLGPPQAQLHAFDHRSHRTYLATFPLVLPDCWCAAGEPPR